MSAGFVLLKFLLFGKKMVRVATKAAMRMVTENRQGQRCFSYLTFHIIRSGRDSEVIPFSTGKLLSVNGLGHLRGKRNGEFVLQTDY